MMRQGKEIAEQGCGGGGGTDCETTASPDAGRDVASDGNADSHPND